LGEWESAAASGKLPAIEVEHLSPRRRAGELAMLMLRLSRGIDFIDFQERTGMDPAALWAETISRFAQVGLLEADNRGVRLSDAGIAVADALASEFLQSCECENP
jgi:coproporphyrinogen III oxidase-like Fe-S oxidoreductase